MRPRSLLAPLALSFLVCSPCAAEPPAFTPEQQQYIRELVRQETAKARAEAAEPLKAEPPATTVPTIDTAPAGGPSTGPFSLTFSGYGDIRAAYYDYAESVNQLEGSRGQSRAGFDLSRFTFEVEGRHEPLGLEFEAEVEFEHGGTGAAVELEQDEFGEFETEVEKGGEVLLEELYVSKYLGDNFTLKAGRFYVAMGLLSDYYRPTDYLATGRPEAETTVIPGVWDEIGIELEKELEIGRLRLQIVNGLDSTGFGGAGWVSTGHQEKFEGTRAQDLAYVARFDSRVADGLLLGASAYLAPSTTQNRPKDDLDVDGGLYVVDAHARYVRDPFRVQGVVIWGHLNDAEEISQRNSRLSNTLGVDRTPVADEALGTWAELGYNVAPLVRMSGIEKLEPFLRFDYYDTALGTADTVIDNPRYERTVYTAGVAYTYDEFITTKLDWTHRRFGSSEIDSENMIRIGLGFVY